MSSASPFFIDQVLFVVLPYVAFVIFLVISIRRYRSDTFSFSSLSSQFLENKQHFWGLVPFHYGIIAVMTAHFVAFLLPGSILWWNGDALRLYVLEVGGLIFGLLTLVGLVSVVVRRHRDHKMRMVTSVADWVLFSIFFVQVLTGIYTAVFNGWGSSWFAATAAPYLWSLVWLNPDMTAISAMPWMVKIHIIGAYTMVAFFPFTRLVHVLVVPNPYLWRKPQVVRWYAQWRDVRRTA
jgi:nitrate reductase gamma subunit